MVSLLCLYYIHISNFIRPTPQLAAITGGHLLKTIQTGEQSENELTEFKSPMPQTKDGFNHDVLIYKRNIYT